MLNNENKETLEQISNVFSKLLDDYTDKEPLTLDDKIFLNGILTKMIFSAFDEPTTWAAVADKGLTVPQILFIFANLIGNDVRFYYSHKVTKRFDFIFHESNIKTAQEMFPNLIDVTEGETSNFDIGRINGKIIKQDWEPVSTEEAINNLNRIGKSLFDEEYRTSPFWHNRKTPRGINSELREPFTIPVDDIEDAKDATKKPKGFS